MKRRGHRRSGRAMLLPLLLLALAAPVYAQTPAGCAPMVPVSASPTAEGGQHGAALWDYQKELGLSDAQVGKIHQTFDAFQDKVKANFSRLKGLSQEISSMVKGGGDIGAIRAKLQQAANLQVEAHIEDIQTGRAINAILTPSQRQKWSDIQARLQTQALPPPNK